jgi:hypothetical protein
MQPLRQRLGAVQRVGKLCIDEISINVMTYEYILKRTGAVLLVIGLIDIGAMMYCIVNNISYSSSFNIFAVIGGIFLMCGSLRAASTVRYFAVFMFAAFITCLVVGLFAFPLDLVWTYIHLNPKASAVWLLVVVFMLALLFWVQRELGQPVVQSAYLKAGIKIRSMVIPIAIGIGLASFMWILMTVLFTGENASRAKALALKELGAGYRYHVTSLTMTQNNQGTFVSGEITAWNDNQIRDFPFNWNESK